MKYHIMSDNTYFIMGVSHAEEIRKSHVSIIKIPRDISRASPSPGDVFMLYIPEPGRTREFIRRFSLHLLRMVILVDAPVFRQVKKYFPWVMSAAISLRGLFSVIHLAEMAPARYRKVSGQAARIISLLTAGVSVRDAAEKLNWSGGRGNFTQNSSAVAPEDYQPLSAGVAWNSSAVRFLYVRHFDMTGTSLQIPGYQYRSKNFLEFPEFLYRQSRDNISGYSRGDSEWVQCKRSWDERRYRGKRQAEQCQFTLPALPEGKQAPEDWYKKVPVNCR